MKEFRNSRRAWASSFWFVFMVLSLAGAAAPAEAQVTNKSGTAPATSGKMESAAKKPSAGPFHGKLAALDRNAKTITVGKRTFYITADSKIKKSGVAASLTDAVVGEPISGYVKPSEDGRLIATTVNIGPKAEGKTGAAGKTATEKKRSK